MESNSRTTSTLPPAIDVRRLFWLRFIAISGPALSLLLANRVYRLGIPVLPLAVIVGALAVVNLWTWRRLSSSNEIANGGFFLQMLIDVAALSGILYYAGGASNPFAFFYLVPLIITATVLPRRYTWMMAAITACAYTSLMFARRPLPSLRPSDGQSAFDLHVAGMWLGFVVIAALIAHYVVRLADSLRERERVLADEREQAMNDEQIVSLATLAAGAAHELGTPLATMAVIVDELERETEPGADPVTRKRLDILRSQIRRCKDALSVMSDSGGLSPAESGQPLPLDRFLTDIIERVRSLRPDSDVRLEIDGDGPVPMISGQRRLAQALSNLLDNALKASPRDVALEADWTPRHIVIDILDRGSGLEPDAVRRPKSTSRREGLGIGIFLTVTAIRQLGGEVRFEPRPGGGTRVRVSLPTDRSGRAAA